MGEFDNSIKDIFDWPISDKEHKAFLETCLESIRDSLKRELFEALKSKSFLRVERVYARWFSEGN